MLKKSSRGNPHLYLQLFLIVALVLLPGCQLKLRRLLPRATFTPVPLPTRTPMTHAPADPVITIPATQLLSLTTEEQLAQMQMPKRDLRDLTIRLNPEITDVPIMVNETAPNFAVGDKQPFRVHNLDTNSNAEITAELIYKTEVVYVWVEADQPYDRKSIIRSIDRFSQQSYPAEVAFFGSEWYPGIDNDPRIHVLHATGIGGGVAGYYSSADEYSRLANPYSNEKEMFYINLAWLNSSADYDYYETVLAHEFQHMIHWFHDRNEETWINEGLSEYAQEVAGYDSDVVFATAFTNAPDTQLNTWRVDTSSNAEHYGSAYLFVNYLTQRFGADTTRALVAQSANGRQGVTDALRARGHDETFDTVFGDWVVANFVDDPQALGLEGVYGYDNLRLPQVSIARLFEAYPAEAYRDTVQNYATDYLRLSGGDALIDFAGETATQIAPVQPYSGKRFWWSNRGDDSNSRLTRLFDMRVLSPGTPVEMEVAMWWDIEKNYDYGYVVASTDGQKWQILPGQQTTTENPSGNSFGAAYTAASRDQQERPAWVIERFDLSPFAGEQVWVRFEYVTDDAANANGWLIDDIQISALDYATDFEENVDGWESEGWLLTNNHLQQHWLLQLLTFDDETLKDVQRIPVDEQGVAQIELEGLGRQRDAVLAISALTPVTTESASYTLQFSKQK